MPSVISGENLGLFNNTLNSQGAGTGGVGNNGDRTYINSQSGNLVIQHQDEFLKGAGLDVGLVRTYNSQGLMDDDNGDNWKLNIHQKLYQQTGTINTAGSSITKVYGDGAEAVFSYDESRGLYVTTEGSGAHDTLSYDTTSGIWTWTDGTPGVEERYNSSLQLIQSLDRDGNSIDYSYTDSLLTQITDNASGQTVYLDYSGDNLTQIRTLSDGQEQTRVSYSYDDSNRLSQVIVDLTPEDITDNNTFTTTYTYDGDSTRVSSITNSDGTSQSFTYELIAGNWCIKTVTDGEGKVTTMDYGVTAEGDTLTLTDPLGHSTIYTHDAEGRLSKIEGPEVDGVRATTTYSYDADDNLILVVDAEGKENRYVYDANGNLTHEQNGAGDTIQYYYDDQNRLISEVRFAAADSDGYDGPEEAGIPNVTRYVYDSEGHVRFELKHGWGVVEYRYNEAGQQISEIEYLRTAYNTSYLGVEETPTEAEMESWVTSAAWKLFAKRVDRTYDFRGQLDSVTTYSNMEHSGDGTVDGTELVTRYVYDQAGRLIQRIDPRGEATADTTDFITHYSYDGLGRLLRTTDALDNVTFTQYDDANHTITTELANGLATSSVYDGNGRVVSITQRTPDAIPLGTTTHHYDAAGNLRYSEDPTGRRSYTLYDEMNRAVASINNNGELVETVYDDVGNVLRTIGYATRLTPAQIVSLINDDGTPADIDLDVVRPATNSEDRIIRTVYDNAHRAVFSIDAAGYVSQNYYDGVGRITKSIDYATAIDLTRLGSDPNDNDVGALLVDHDEDRLSRYGYNLAGELIYSLDREGSLTQHNYDAVGRLYETVHFSTAISAGLISNGSWSELLNAVGSSEDDIHSYVISNTKNQVTGIIDAEGYLTETVYDVAGNATQTIRYANKANAFHINYTIDMLRPASDPQDQITTNVYNELNQLISTTNHEGTTTYYEYDEVGNLVKTTLAYGTEEARTLTTQYDLQGRVVAELSAEGEALLTGNLTQEEIDAIWAEHGKSYAYDQAGRRISITDANGHKTLLYYDDAGRLAYQVNALGEVTETRYNAFGQVSDRISYFSRIDPMGLTGGDITTALTGQIMTSSAHDNYSSSTSYTKRGLVQSVQDALGYNRTYSYNAFGEVSELNREVTSGSYLTTQYQYNNSGQLISTIDDPSGINRTTQAEYDAFGRITISTDGKGNSTTYSYDKLGRVITVEDALTNNVHSSYDAFGRVLTQTDALGNTTTTSYDDTNRTITITTPEGISTSTTHNRHGETVEIVDGEGTVTQYQYDKNGQLERTIQDPTGLAIEQSQDYNGAGQLIETTGANGIRTTYTYDDANRLLSRSVDPDGLNLITTYSYDGLGRIAETTDANGVITRSEYDAEGQLIATVVDPITQDNPDGLNLRTEFSYDGVGRQISVTQGVGTPESRITEYIYDELDRRVQETVDPDGLNIITQYHYDHNDNLVARTDAVGEAEERTTRYVYDQVDQLIYTIDPSGSVTKTLYDANGQVISTVAYANSLYWSQDFSQGADGLTGSGLSDPDFMKVENGRLVIQTQDVTTTSFPGLIGSRNYVFDEHVTFSADVTTGTNSDGRFLLIGAANTGSTADNTYRRHTANFTNGMIYSHYWDTAEEKCLNVLLGTAKDDTDYVVEVESHSTGTTLYVYEKGQSRDDGFIHVVNQTGWGDIQSHIWTRVAENYPNTIMYVDNMEERPDLQLDLDIIDVESLLATNESEDRTSYNVYDKDGRLIYNINGLGYVTEHQYDDNGNRIGLIEYATSIDPQLALNADAKTAVEAAITANTQDRTTISVYDALGRARFGINALGYVSESRYDNLGQITETIGYANAIDLSALGADPTEADILALLTPDATKDQSTITVYDNAGRVTQVTDAEGNSETYGYDSVGNRISLTNKKGDTWTYAYDAAGRLIQEITPEVKVTRLVINDSVDPVEVPIDSSQVDSNIEARWILDQDSGSDVVDSAGTHSGTINGGAWVDDAERGRVLRVENSEYITIPDDANLTGEVPQRTISLWFKADDAQLNSNKQILYFEGGSVRGLNIYLYDGSLYVGGWNTPTTESGWTGTFLTGATVTSNEWHHVSLTLDGGATIAPDSLKMYFDGELITSGEGSKLWDHAYARIGGSTTGSMYFHDSSAAVALSNEAHGFTGLLSDVRAYNRVLNAGDMSTIYEAGMSEENAGLPATNITTITLSESITTQMSYDAHGNLISRTEAFGTEEARTTSYQYDALGRQIKTIFPTQNVYDETLDIANNYQGRNETTVTPETQTYYDSLGNAIAGQDVLGNFSYKVYDTLGQVRFEIDAERYVTEYKYDNFGNQISLTRYINAIDEIAFSQESSTITGFTQSEVETLLTLDNEGPATDRTMQFNYDLLNRLTGTIQPEVYSFDSSAAEGSQYFTASPTTVNTYNSFGEVIKQSELKNPLTNEWIDTHYYFDNRGNKTAEINALGYVTEYQYDANGNLIQQSEYANAVTSWDSTGYTQPTTSTLQNNPDAANGYDRVYRYEYDKLNQKTADIQVGAVFSTEENGAITQQQQDITTSYGYDAVGNLTTVTDNSGNLTTTHYDKLGRIDAVVQPTRDISGTQTAPVTTIDRDIFGNQIHQVNHANGATIDANNHYTLIGEELQNDQHSYSYFDVYGNTIESVDAEGNRLYRSYDAAGNVVKEWRYTTNIDGKRDLSINKYSYDRVGQQTNTTSITPLEDTNATLYINEGSSRLWWYKPPIVVTGTELRYRVEGSDGDWQLADVQENGGIYEVNVSGWVNDRYEYKLSYRRPNETEVYAEGTGSFVIAGNSSTGSTQPSDIWHVNAQIISKYNSIYDNNVEVSYDSLSAYGDGDVRVTLSVHEYLDLGLLGISRSNYFDITETFSAANGDMGCSFSWGNHENVNNFSVTGVKLEKQINGIWTTIYDGSATYADAEISTGASSTHVVGTVEAGSLNARIVSKYKAIDGNQISDNSVEVSYDSLSAYGDGDVRVTLSVHEYLDWVLLGISRSNYFDITETFSAANGDRGVSFSWGLHEGYNDFSVTGVKVEKQIDGAWVTIFDGGATQSHDERLLLRGNTSGLQGVMVSGENTLRSATEIGAGVYWVDVSDLSAGYYSFTPVGTSSLVSSAFEVRGEGSSIKPVVQEHIGSIKSAKTSKYNSIYDNSVEVSYDSLSAYGDGDVRVTLSVHEYLDLGLLGISRSNYFDMTETFSAANGDRGCLFSWEDHENVNDFSVTGVKVEKQIDGVWVTIYDNGGSEYVQRLYINSLPTASETVTFEYRPAGSSDDYQSKSTTKLASGWFQANYDDIANGYYDYRLTVLDSNGVPIDMSSMGGTAAGTIEGSVDILRGGQSMVESMPPETEVLTPITTQTLDRWGNVISVTDANNHIAEYRYDYLNNAIKEVRSESTVWNEDGTSSLVSPTSYAYYDAAGRAIGQRDANGNLNIQRYNQVGQLIQEVTPYNDITTHSYDALGRHISTTDANGNVKSMGYDRNNQLTSETRYSQQNSADYITSYKYDEAGNRIAVTNGEGETTRYFYGQNGNLTITRYAEGGGNNYTDQFIAYSYDAQGNKTSEINGNGDYQTWDYDIHGKLIGHRDLGGATYNYSYNYLGLLTNQTSSRGQDLRQEYYENGRLKYIYDDALDRETYYEYDMVGMLTREKFTNTGTNEIYQDNHIEYDELNRITKVDDNRFSLEYYYDANGNRRRTVSNYYDNANVAHTQDNWYTYDAMDRIILSQGALVGDEIIIQNNQGRQLYYDAMGNRTQAQYIEEDVAITESYAFDEQGRIIETRKQEGTGDNNLTSVRHYDLAGRQDEYTGYDAGSLDERRVMTYNDNGWLVSQKGYEDDGDHLYTINYAYDSLGNTKSHTIKTHKNTKYTKGYDYSYEKFDSYKESNVRGVYTIHYGDGDSTSTGDTFTTYDVNGNINRLVDVFDSFTINEGVPKFSERPPLDFIVNTQGHILKKVESETEKEQHYYYINGSPIGSVGELSDADFDYNYTPVSESYPSVVPATYVVTEGDTLQSIALAVFGDSKLWYLIADANGITSDSDLSAGQSLTIPNNISNIHNSYDTFKPYDPKEIIGDTKPTLPDPPPPPVDDDDGGCGGGIGGIIVAIVSIVVAAIIAPYVASNFIGHFIAGAVGNMAGQAVGIAIGVQDKFNWGSVAAAGLSAGIFKGTEWGRNITKMAGSTEIGDAMIGGAAQNAISQGINIITGQQDKFSWSSLATAAIAAPITNNINASILGPEKYADPRLRTFGDDLATGLVRGTVNNGVRILIDGKGKMQWGQIAADAFGNAIGNSIARSLQPKTVSIAPKKPIEQQQAGKGHVGANDLDFDWNALDQRMRNTNLMTASLDADYLHKGIEVDTGWGSVLGGPTGITYDWSGDVAYGVGDAFNVSNSYYDDYGDGGSIAGINYVTMSDEDPGVFGQIWGGVVNKAQSKIGSYIVNTIFGWHNLLSDPLETVANDVGDTLNMVAGTVQFASDQLWVVSHYISGGLVPDFGAVERNIGRNEVIFDGIYQVQQVIENKDYEAIGGMILEGIEAGLLAFATRSIGGVKYFDDVPDSAGQKISEAGYLQRIERLESIYGSPNVHSLEKHGAQTTGMKQYRRVQQEHYPNPTTGAPGNKTKTASKFLTNKDHYEALRSAILQRKANPEINDFDIVMDRNIGVNIKNLGSHKNRGPYSADYTNTARVRFDPNTGKMFTAFPIPEKK